MKEHRALVHHGGRLLVWLIKRLSIKREDWTHTYFHDGSVKDVPTVRWKRKDYLMPYTDRLIEFININQPCVVIGMGKICAEVLVGGSIISKKAGTYWPTRFDFRKKANLRRVWISQTTDAALYNPELSVDITRLIWRAATEAGIKTKIDYTLTIPDFWFDYL